MSSVPYIVICGLSNCTLFFHIPHKWHYFKKKVTEPKMCVLTFSKPFVWSTSHSDKNSSRYNHIYISHLGKYWLFLLDFNQTWNFLTDFHKIPNYQSSWKSVQCESSWSLQTDWQMDGQTWLIELIVSFCNFVNAPINPYRTKMWTFLGVLFLTVVLQTLVLDVCNEINWRRSVCNVSGCGYYDLGFTIPGRNRNFSVINFVRTCCCPVDVEPVCMG
jgi:hypothetical protein